MLSKVQVLKARHQIFAAMRAYFEKEEFIEVHTPLLVSNPGLEPHLQYFETDYQAQMAAGPAIHYYLPTSPEYHLKKALALGVPRIFEITKSFRNGEASSTHEPEFFMLEWYRHPGELKEIAADVLSLCTLIGARWAPTEPWQKAKNLTVNEAFAHYCGLNLEGALVGTAPSLEVQARAKGFASVSADDDWESAYFKLMIEQIEPNLGKDSLLFLWDYPASMCAQARINALEPHWCERFEVYWKGMELGNAFAELTSEQEQRARCQKDQIERRKLYGKSPELDEEFLQALLKIKGPAAGIAVGLDRLVQCLLGATHIQEVIPFPHKALNS